MAAHETWAKRVEGWRASGLTAAEYGRRHQLNEGSLKWWKWRLGAQKVRARKRTPVSMSPLTFVELASSAGHEAIEIVFESGTRIRVPSGFDASTLARVVAVLEHR
jgi:hypothetical protein